MSRKTRPIAWVKAARKAFEQFPLPVQLEGRQATADFSRIRRVKLDRFTIDRLMLILSKLDQRVEVDARFGEKAV